MSHDKAVRLAMGELRRREGRDRVGQLGDCVNFLKGAGNWIVFG